MIRILLGLLALLTPTMAHAEWKRAESNNFIVYSNGTEADLKARVVQLEKFGIVLQTITGAKRAKKVPVKIKIYFVADDKAVRDTLAFTAGGVAGYYSTVMRGPFAVMPRASVGLSHGSSTRLPELSADTILRHELTHHFTFQYFPAAYPSWYTEGFADYAGAIEIGDDDVVKIGLFLEDRSSALRSQDWVPLKTLLNPPPEGYDNGFIVYSEGWILVHYFNNNDEGKILLRNYLRALNAGVPRSEALKMLGDIDDLNKKVYAYSRQRNLPATATKFVGLDPGPIEIQSLSPAEDDLVEVEIRLSSGVPVNQADTFASKVRGIANRYPKNPYALRIETETDMLANEYGEAQRTVDQWAMIAPDDPWVSYYRGQLALKSLGSSKSTDDGAWAAARNWFVLARKSLPDEPRVLRGYYQSYSNRGILPPPDAQNALAHALDLIPYESDLRYAVAADYERRGLIQDSIDTIAPIAYGSAEEDEKQKRRRERNRERYALAGEDLNLETPREMLSRLERKKAGTWDENVGQATGAGASGG